MAGLRSLVRWWVVGCAVAALCVAGHARAQSAPAQPIVKPGPCDAYECRQFDFWVGEWNVLTPDGQLAGTSRIERILGGCVIFENWSGTKGTDGKSFNNFSATDQKWHQTWVDNQGTRLDLVGEFRDGSMVLEGDAPAAKGDPVRNRITWQKLPDGRVRQHWQVSSDGGLKWTDAFIGLYTAKKSKPAAKGPQR